MEDPIHGTGSYRTWRQSVSLAWSVVVGIAPSLLFCLSLQQAKEAIIFESTKRPACARKNLQVVQVNSIDGFICSCCTCYWAVGMCILLCEPCHLLSNAYKMQYLLMRLIVTNIDYVLNLGWSNQKHQLQRCIKSLCRIPFTCIGTQPHYEECSFWAILGQKVHSMTNSSNVGHILRPHLVEVCCVIKSSDKGHILRPHLVKFCCVTKSSNEGHILRTPLVKVCCMIRPQMWGIFLGHIWSKSPV